MNIYVGNLPYSVRDDELRRVFEPYGEVISAEVIMDRRTKRSRGYGFVEMSDDAAATNAIEALNGSDMQGRSLRVDESRPSAEKRSRRTAEGDRGHPAKRRRRQEPGTAEPDGPKGLFGFIRRLFG